MSYPRRLSLQVKWELSGLGELGLVHVYKLTGRMKEMVGLSSTPSGVAKKHADINIFTVASGLLYEVS